METFYKSTEWSQIEKDFIEWDNKGHSKASQRDILDWLKELFLPVSLPGRENLKKELIIKITMKVIEDYYKNESKGWTSGELDNLRVEWYDISSKIADELEGKDKFDENYKADDNFVKLYDNDLDTIANNQVTLPVIQQEQSEGKVRKTAEDFYTEKNGGMTADEQMKLGSLISPIWATILMKEYGEYIASQFAQPKDMSKIRKIVEAIFNKFCTLVNKDFGDYIIRDKKGFIKALTSDLCQQTPGIIEIEKQLLNRFGFIDDGVDAENQLKIFSFMDWYEKWMGEKKGVDKDIDHAITGR